MASVNVELIPELITLLLIACAVGILTKIVKLPYTIALVIIGSIIGFLSLLPEIELTKEIVFLIILPPLLFEGALNTDLQHLKDNLKPVGLLSTLGVLFSVLVVGYIIHVTLSLPLEIALLFGAMITPTDPVSVLATFKTLGAPKQLTTIVEGESILNDGTAVVIFAIILEMVRGGNFDLVYAATKFVFVCGIGALIGFAIGYATYRAMRRIDDAEIEVALTIVTAFSSFLMAEALHGSGVIAVVIAGLMVGNYGRILAMSPSTRVTLSVFWGMVVFLINSVVFLLIGLDIAANLSGYGMEILIAIAAVILSRTVVYPILSLPGLKMPASWKHVVFWGGLRGTIPVALALSLGDVPYRSLLASMTLGVVLFSLIVQGLSLELLIRRIFRRDERIEDFETSVARFIALNSAMKELRRMISFGEVPEEIGRKVTDELSEEIERVRVEMETRSKELMPELEVEVWRKVLIAAKGALRDAILRGQISDEAARKVEAEIDAKLQSLRDSE